MRFFFQKANFSPEQLVFKTYATNDYKVGYNNSFRQQLWAQQQCPSFKVSQFENISYSKKDLTQLFIAYGKCNGETPAVIAAKQKGDFFHLTIRPRVTKVSLEIGNGESGLSRADRWDKFGFAFGTEAEFVLPFNKNKWSVLIEPVYHSFRGKKVSENQLLADEKLFVEINYKSLDINVGLRHYFFFNYQSKVFIDASFVFNKSFNSSVDFTRENGIKLKPLEITPKYNIAGGVGYKYSNRYSIQFRFHTYRKVLAKYTFWKSDYRSVELIFGYSLW